MDYEMWFKLQKLMYKCVWVDVILHDPNLNLKPVFADFKQIMKINQALFGDEGISKLELLTILPKTEHV